MGMLRLASRRGTAFESPSGGNWGRDPFYYHDLHLVCMAKYTKRGEMRIKRDWIANDHYTLQHSTNLFFPFGNHHHHHAVDDIFLCIGSIVLYAWSGISSILLESSSHLQWRRP